MKRLLLILNIVRLFPHLIMFKLSRNNLIIKADLERWIKIMEIKYSGSMAVIYLLSFYPEFRNLFYYRVGRVSFFLNIICPKMSTLYISSKDVGEGLFIQHGFATIIAAKSIGKNCWINQQVTIGFSSKLDCPVLLDNVAINAGAKVIGNVVIGNNSIVGANSVVVKNVPENCTVVGVPAYIIRRNGIKVKEEM